MSAVDMGTRWQWRGIRHRMTPFWYFVLAVAIVSLGGSAGGAWALSSGGYCIDEFIPGHVAFEVPPYVQQLTETSVLIRWHTDIPTDGTIHWGETKTIDRVATGGSGQWHDARLTGLKPATTYHYQVQAGADDQMLIESFRTDAGPTGTVTFGVLGDSGTDTAAQHTMASVLAAQEPQLVLHTGDVVYPRGAACFYQARFYDPYSNLLGSVPFYPVVGNHDLKSQGGKPFFTTFDLPANNPQHSERYYSFDAGPVHFVALDSELYHGDGGGGVTAATQKAWLEQDLQQTKQPWKVVYLHRPLYSSGEHGGDTKIRADLAPIFARYGVNVVFSGHDHDYERFKPMDGVTYIVSGGGGAALYTVKPGPQTAFAAKADNILKVTASPARLTIAAVGSDGKAFDQVTLGR